MRLLNSFFILHNSYEDVSGTQAFHISLNPDHYIFKAHFPGNPVVPGVCQVQMALDILSWELGVPLYLDEVKNIKYLSVMIPTEQLDYDVIFHKIKSSQYRVQASVVFEYNGKAYSKMSLTFATSKN